MRIYPASDEQYRLYRHISTFPSEFIEQILLQEDQYFYSHFGVNPVALFRAFNSTYILKERRVGASTITMQLARLYYGLDSSTPAGKIHQILRAFYLELFYSKQDILEAYLNLAPCGGNIEGFPAASLLYFDRDLSELTTGESLLLCVIPQNPVKRNPAKSSSYESIIEARSILYRRWLEKYPGREDSLYHPELMPAILGRPEARGMHFTQMLQNSGKYFGRMSSSLDYSIQEQLEERLLQYVQRQRDLGVSNAAALVLDSRSMELKAMVGSANYFDISIQGMVNGAASRRSPGSTLKPFIYALALDQGLIHSQSILFDRPISFSTYAPDNYKRDFKGPVPAWSALVNSRNIPAVELASRLKGDENLYQLLNKAPAGNLKEESYYGLSIVLGSAEFSMLELAGLYATLLNGGALKDITAGEEIVVQDFREQSLFSSGAASIVVSMLKRNPPPGEGFKDFREVQDERSMAVAYKTGTSIGFKDAWSIALYGHYVIAVWVGNFDGQGNPSFLGREMAAPLLFEIAGILDSTFEDDPYEFPDISGVREVEVCSVSGMIPTEYCGATTPALFLPGISPIAPCSIHRPVVVDADTGYRLNRERENSRRVVREVWPTDMLKLFDEAGIPRPVPPPYESEAEVVGGARRGSSPRIISPLAGASYILRPGDKSYGSIPLAAAADGDVRELFWFVDGAFYGRSDPKKTLYWEPGPGVYHLIALDDKGLSVDRIVSVTMEPRTSFSSP